LNKSYETIEFGDSTANADRLGIIIAWLVSHQLTEANFEQENALAISRLRLEDMTGAEFFATVLHGEFGSAFLNQNGQDFVEDYFLGGTYDHDYNQVKVYTADERLLCNQVSLKISEAYRKFVEPPSIGKKLAKVLRFS
tara:strand:+ start:125 stop:541 length:417 start_codon:yes stop_codon:yes gene_type:complete